MKKYGVSVVLLLAVLILNIGVVQAQKNVKLIPEKFAHLSMNAPFNDCSKGDVKVCNDSDKWLCTKGLGDNMIMFGANDPNSVKYVKVYCWYKKTDLEAFITSRASQKSIEKGFEYMSIEKVKDAKLGKYHAKLLAFGNTYLNEAFVGGIYGIEKDGYTYCVEYYSEDNPSDIKLTEKILKSIVIGTPENEITIVEKEEHYSPKEAKTKEQIEQDRVQLQKNKKFILF
jgi:hypothetical protein